MVERKEERLERFFYWIKERTEIQIKKDNKEPWPWTEDPILREYKFTNAYRENDRTTVWFRENIRDPLKNKPEVYMATIIFRWFNLIETGKTLIENNLHLDWDPEEARIKILPQKKWVTGAYMIKSPTGKNKVRGICETITNVWNQRQSFLKRSPWNKLQEMNTYLEGYPFFGPFLAYEIVTDLRFTYIGKDAIDINTWANAGPGAMRGLNRIHGRPLDYTSKKNDWCGEMKVLLDISPHYELGGLLELREIEHSLCEFDKYERVRTGLGAPRSKYYPGISND
jgi:hypothetical protein